MQDNTVQIKVTEEEWIVACLCTLGEQYARTLQVQVIVQELRAERGLSQVGVFGYLDRFEKAVREHEPALIPHIEHMYKHLSDARKAAGSDRPQVQA